MLSRKASFCTTIVLLLSISLFFPIVAAVQYCSFAQPDTTTQKDVYLYYANGTLQGMYNTTSSGIAIPNDTDGDFMFVIKPQYSNPLDEPGTFLDGAVGWLQTNVLSLVIIGALGGLLFKRW
jgi:hypothetical protein